MKFKYIILILVCLLLLPSCANSRYGSRRDVHARGGLMLLNPNEFARNKPLKFSKTKMKKQLARKIKGDKRRRH